MRNILLPLVLIFSSRVMAEGPLPQISPSVVNDIQRLAITVNIAEFPHSQSDLTNYLALPPHEFLIGIGHGKSDTNKPHLIFALTDPKDPLGYYGMNLYYGTIQPDGSPPLVEALELFFYPGNLGHYPPTGEFVLKGLTSPETVADFRAKMHKQNMTPGEFIKDLYKK